MDQPQVLGTIPWSTRGSTKEGREESNQGAKLQGSGGLSGQDGRTVRTDHADSPARSRGQSAKMPRIVRPEATDIPKMPPEPPETNREKRTVREDRADRPRGIRTVRYWSSDRPQTSCNENLKQNRIKTRTRRTSRRTGMNCLLADSPQGAGGQSAGSGRTVRQFKQNWKSPSSRSQLNLLITRSPKR
jgi:hypothetical protein